MKLKKCPMCKVMVPGKSESCPVCGTEYTKFQYFKMNNLSKCIWIILAIIIVYNSIVIISFNRRIRGYLDELPKDIEIVEDLRNDYNRLSFIQKYFVHSAEIELIEDYFIDEDDIEIVENYICSVHFEQGSRMGEYSGEMIDGIPDGQGFFSYYLEDGRHATYHGKFEDGEIMGIGTMTYEDGSKYVGEFYSGVLNGYGIVYNSDGYIVKKGNFISGRLNGEGTIYDNFGEEIYSGRFAADTPIESDYKAVCTETTFAQLEADTEKYVNKNLAISGVITDIAIQEDMTIYYIISIAGNNHKNICIELVGNKKVNIRQGDKLTFYGYCSGYRQYISNSGAVNGGMIIKTYYAD